MKESPQAQNLEKLLRSSKLVAGGFMGDDVRSFCEIIDADMAELSRLRFTVKQVAERMKQITNIAISGLGTWVKVDEKRQAKVDEAKGLLTCPWPHPGKFAKRITIVRLAKSDISIRWSDLNIHLIGVHGFFEGKGSKFRIEPKKLITTIFVCKATAPHAQSNLSNFPATITNGQKRPKVR
jgi:hypothetical protein